MNAAVVNISGRQRMLSQRAAMFASRMLMPNLTVEQRRVIRQELCATIELFELSHNSLLAGKEDWDLPGNPSPTIRSLYFEAPVHLDKLVRQYIDKVKIILAQDDSLCPDAQLIQDVLDMAQHSLLAALDRVVYQYQQESDEQYLAAQMQLVQAEKLSSLGRLVAGIAHEIRNPVNFIHGNVSYVKDYAHELIGLITAYQLHYPHPPQALQDQINSVDLGFILEDFERVLQSIQMGSDRIQEIVRALRTFSYSNDQKFDYADIHEGLESTLLILKHRLNDPANRIQVKKEYGKIPALYCSFSELNQVFMNILSNAIDALIDHADQCLTPTISIRTGQIKTDAIAIWIKDNGCGIPTDLQSKVFESFFTTKPVGKGTGLGLAISRQIIEEKHGGHLSFQSELGHGTEFYLELPIR
jgi:signal transduction histidine kinase